MTARMGEEEVLALALEGRVHAASGQTAELVALAGNLALLPDPEIDPRWAAALEARLLGEAPRLRVVEPAVPPEPLPSNVVQMPMRRFVVRRAIAAVVAAAMLGAFPVIAVAGALPGTPGYGIKRAAERLHIAMFGDAVADGFTYAALAQRRVGEAGQLIALRSDPKIISVTLRDASIAVAMSARLVLDNTDDAATLQRLSDMTLETQRRIAALASETPMSSKPALQDALDAAIDLQADVARLLGQAPAEIADPIASVRTGTPAKEPQASAPKQPSYSKPTSDVRKTVRNDPTGKGKDVDDAVRTCPVVDPLNIRELALLMCDIRDATY